MVVWRGQQKLSAANLGDSGFMIIRSGRTIFKSPPQQHDFNFPYQLGSAGGDPPNTAEVRSPAAAQALRTCLGGCAGQPGSRLCSSRSDLPFQVASAVVAAGGAGFRGKLVLWFCWQGRA